MYVIGTIGKMQMDLVAKYTDKRVTADYVDSGFLVSVSGILRSVTPFRNVQIGNGNIAFVGRGIAIRSISTPEGIIYRNKVIPPDYNARREKEIHSFVLSSFTNEGIAQRKVTRQELVLLRSR